MMILSTTQWRLPAWAVVAVAALVAVLLVLALVIGIIEARARRDARASLATLETRLAALQARLDDVSNHDVNNHDLSNQKATVAPATVTSPEYLITSLGGPREESAGCQQVTLTAPAFADAVLRESVVHTASFLHGVRRALAPESRNRIRFEMRRELKRSRKERKVELREALREYRARHRAEVPADAGRIADGAA